MADNSYISNTANLLKYRDLPQYDNRGQKTIIVEYVWVDSSNGTRSKSKTMLYDKAYENGTVQFTDSKGNKKDTRVPDVKNFEEWNFDGSSTNQAQGDNSDVYLRPVAVYRCPFRLGDNLLVLATTYMSDGKPNNYNFRHDAATLMEKYKGEGYQFGIEQEYTLLEVDGSRPYGWPRNGFPAPQGPYYCANGAGRVFCRDIVEAHYKACLYAGIQISGTNAEVMPSQWEFQVGICDGIDAADQLWMARFLLSRVSEEFGVKITLAAKPVQGDWNGTGLHTNVSTEAMRAEGGMKAIEEAMPKLAKRHTEHMKVYGEGNEARMTGAHETASYDKFSWGVANRGSSVRVNRAVAEAGKGYFEDRRPASNADPYQITGMIVETLSGKADGIDVGKKVAAVDVVDQTVSVSSSIP